MRHDRKDRWPPFVALLVIAGSGLAAWAVMIVIVRVLLRYVGACT